MRYPASTVARRLIGLALTRLCIAEDSIYLEFGFEIGFDIYNLDKMSKLSGHYSEDTFISSLPGLVTRPVTGSRLADKIIVVEFGDAVINILKDDDNLESYAVDLGKVRISSNELEF